MQRRARWSRLDEQLRLVPCVFSPHRYATEISQALERYPAQCMNTREAVEGWVIELRLESRPGGPLGSLSEVLVATGAQSVTIVALDGEVDASLSDNGWVVDRVRFQARVGSLCG